MAELGMSGNAIKTEQANNDFETLQFRPEVKAFVNDAQVAIHKQVDAISKWAEGQWEAINTSPQLKLAEQLRQYHQPELTDDPAMTKQAIQEQRQAMKDGAIKEGNMPLVDMTKYYDTLEGMLKDKNADGSARFSEHAIQVGMEKTTRTMQDIILNADNPQQASDKIWQEKFDSLIKDAHKTARDYDYLEALMVQDKASRVESNGQHTP